MLDPVFERLTQQLTGDRRSASGSAARPAESGGLDDAGLDQILQSARLPEIDATALTARILKRLDLAIPPVAAGMDSIATQTSFVPPAAPAAAPVVTPVDDADAPLPIRLPVSSPAGRSMWPARVAIAAGLALVIWLAGGSGSTPSDPRLVGTSPPSPVRIASATSNGTATAAVTQQPTETSPGVAVVRAVMPGTSEPVVIRVAGDAAVPLGIAIGPDEGAYLVGDDTRPPRVVVLGDVTMNTPNRWIYR